VLTRSRTSWTEQPELSSSYGTGTDAFGRSVAIGGDTVVVAAPLAVGENGFDQGAAYVFTS
jgi:hypothetical protein